MILAETWYKTHDGELLAIVEPFKTWKHYLEGSQHEVLVLINHNKLRRFIDTKSLSFRQVRWDHEVSCYHFWIDYCQDKANGAANALSEYPQQNEEKEEVFRTENVKILHCLQFSLTNTSLSGLRTSAKLLLLHQVFICSMHVLPQLCQFWDTFWVKLGAEGPYQVIIGAIHLRLSELQESDYEAQKIRAEGLKNDYEEIDGVLHYQGLSFVPEAIQTELISQHHHDPLAGHFSIDKTRELVGRKYYWPGLRRDVESYVWGCDVCLASKAIRHKSYKDLHFLLIPTHRWKDLSIDFVIGLQLFADWKKDNYDSIFVIVNLLTKMVHYKLVKVTIHAPGLAEVILDVIVWHHGLPDSIMTDRGSLFTTKFWSSLCYFLAIKWRLSTAFHPRTNDQTKRQNSTMEAYLWAFVNFEQNNWAKLLPIAEIAYNNAKNASTGHTLFELNCTYYPRVLYKEDVDPRSQSKLADEFLAELRKLMIVCRENLHYTWELQKRAHDNGVKPRSYTPGKKVWLNSKYIKVKHNQKLEAKFFELFRVFHFVRKQAYKLKLPMNWRIHDVFFVSLLE